MRHSLYLIETNEMNTYFKNRTLNIFKYSTCTLILRESDVVKEILNFKGENEKTKLVGKISYLLLNRLFADNITIFLDAMGIHQEFDGNIMEQFIKQFIIPNIEVNDPVVRNSIASKKVHFIKLQLNEYEENVKRLTKFLQLFKPDLNKGQLCFISYGFYPMKYLYAYSNSIDFLGETRKLVPLKKNGNYKPYIQYPEGMIVDSAFNIDLIDFFMYLRVVVMTDASNYPIINKKQRWG